MLDKTKGIVLYTTQYNDKSAIVHIYTNTYGRASYTYPLQQGRKGKVKKSLFMPFTLLDMEVEHKSSRDMQRIREAAISTPLYSIHNDPVKSIIALFLSEFISRAIKERSSDASLFDFLCKSIQIFDLIEEGKANFHLVFLMQISHFLGFFPNMESYRPDSWFDMRSGTFTSTKPQHPFILSPSDSARFSLIMRMNYKNMHRFLLNRQERGIILEQILSYYRLHHPSMGEMKSLEILKSLFD